MEKTLFLWPHTQPLAVQLATVYEETEAPGGALDGGSERSRPQTLTPEAAMQRARPLLAALLIQSAWLSGENVLDLSVPMTTIETEEAGTYQAANAPLPSNSNTPAPSHRQTMSDQKTPDSNAQWQDDVLWDDFLDSDI